MFITRLIGYYLDFKISHTVFHMHVHEKVTKYKENIQVAVKYSYVFNYVNDKITATIYSSASVLLIIYF
jgi:hypothetical protein